MSFGGYNPAGSSELPFSTPSARMRSRTSSVSSVHSNHGSGYQQNQQQEQQQSSSSLYQSPYSSRPGTPVGGAGEGYFSNGGGYGAGGYGSGTSSSASGSFCMPTPPIPNQQHYGKGGNSNTNGYESPTAVSSSIPTFYSHSRTHSNASETSLNIDTDLLGDDSADGGGGPYSPVPASSLSSSASSSRRGSFSDSGNGGGFFNRKFGKTFRPEPHQSPEDYPMNRLDGDETNDDDDDPQGRRKMRTRKNNQKGGGGNVGVRDIFNDWDLLLPSTDPYENDDDLDDQDLNEDEKRKKRQLSKKGWESPKGQTILLTILVTIAVFVRIWKLAIPSAVVFDEQHFGGFAADYLRGEFFMDIHPPLGKMLFAVVAYMLGFDGNFDFIPGNLYSKNVPYIGMRMFAVACGVGLIPISYLTMKRSGHSTQAAMLCAIFVTFENAMITQSRFILLDAPMMLFMGYTMLAWINFYNHRNRPFTRGWWFWLIQTGFSLFLSSSVKWVGLFTIATIGLCVLKYLQESRTHLYISTMDFSKQFTALFLCLLVLPATLYIGLHVIDFRLLSNSGSGNAWVSPQFQMTLKGHDVLPVMADVAWDSKVHIRHANTNGGWVHSMPGEYARETSKDQAIQLVEWDDDLTCWQIYPADPKLRQRHNRQKQDRKENPEIAFDGYIYDGDEIRLRHCYSKVALATNDIESLGSNKTYLREVRGIKWLKQPTEETVWRVELVAEGMVPGLADDHGVQPPASAATNTGTTPRMTERELKDRSAESIAEIHVGPDGKPIPLPRDHSKQWHSIKGFRLYNEKQQCYLQSHKVFRSPYSTYQEVGCIQGARQKANTIFIIDQNVNPHLPKTTLSRSYQPLSFFQKFLELNRVMWWTHHDLSAPVHGDDPANVQNQQKLMNGLLSEGGAWSWPLLNRGMSYYGAKETNNYVFFMGNPLLWWGAAAAVGAYMLSCFWSVIKFLKGKQETKVERDRFGITPFYSVASGTFYAGWAIHYFPFFFMSRQVSLHHYLPALYFSILLLVSRLDRTLQSWPARIRYMTGILLMGAVIFSWFQFAPFAYGTDFGSTSRCESLKLLGRWKFLCQRSQLPWARPDGAIARRAAAAAVGFEEDDGESHFYDGEGEGEQTRMEGVVEEQDTPSIPPPPPPVEQAPPAPVVDEKAAEKAAEKERRKEIAFSASEARAKEIQEKNQLVADKEALEKKQRELEERLAAQEAKLERQRQQQQQQQQQSPEGMSREMLEEQLRILQAQLQAKED
ncbi:MAG: Dolichyl-phosphate-mannose-protein mannosyltransferase-domain-containing protein [Linnemannia elongata]|nr:MAG: Dolichyl-phosphate-mannose-protein mannosyltransferase-domain-containing protein [Linnemannia elongata]